MHISVVIPNYNGEELLKKNLPTIVKILEKYAGGKAEIVITDDNSKDNSLVFLKEFAKKENANNVIIKILENNSGKNKGFSGNVNKGVAATKGEIIILLNTDVVPRIDFLAPLLKHFANEKVFAVGCMDESVEDGKIVLRGRGVGKWERGFLIHAAGEIGDSPTTLWVSCGSGAFRKSIWDKIGGLNQLYNPFYWEDIDLSYKAQKAGYSVLFEDESIVRHEHTKGAIKKNYSSDVVNKTAYCNQFFFVWLNITDKNLLINHMLWLPRHLLNALKGKDTAFLSGFLLAVQQLPQVLRQRQIIQKLFVIMDKAILAEV